MSGGSLNQFEAPQAGGGPRISARHQAGAHVARLLQHPLLLAIVALGFGTLAGLGGYLASGSDKTPPGQSAKANSSKLGGTGVKHSPVPNLPPPDTQLSFAATFTGSTLDTQVWATCYWYVSPGSGCTHLGVYPENEWYLPSQDEVSDGALHLIASSVPTSGTNSKGKTEIFPCRSGMVTTDPSFRFTYGYVQIVARIPKGRNTWPALWMLPANQAEVLPEIDLMEVIGTQTNRPAVAFHPTVGPQQRLALKTADLSTGWHTFGLNWEPGSITWYIDGKAVFTVVNNVPSQPMYILANLAVTNAFLPLQLPGSCSGSLSIRSIKVWQKST
jgi:beta-glucanase (GH16 family)